MRNIYLIFILIFAFTFNGNSRDTKFLKGVDEIMQEDFKKAQKDFYEDAIKQPSFSSYYNLGVASGYLNEWSKAKWAFESSLKYRPLSGDAQYNAKFATHEISEDKDWVHPYPWLERIVLGFGTTTWTIFVSASSLILGILIFNMVSKGRSRLKKWCIRLFVPVLILFLISFYGVYEVNKHYNTERYGILKEPKTQFYISPNGVQISDEIDPASRFYIMKYFKDSTWIQVKSEEHNFLWIKSEDLYTY